MSKAARLQMPNRRPQRGSGDNALLQRKQSIGFPELQLNMERGSWSEEEIPRLQAKLQTHGPGDQYEQEADRVADSVFGRADHRKHQDSKRRKPPVHLLSSRSSLSQVAELPDSVKAVFESGRGQPLDNTTRRLMESRLGGHNFGAVRIHIDEQASEVARSLGAQAYTVGRDIGFARGLYSPGTSRGEHLLAHELVHVIQQRSVPSGSQNVLQRKSEGSARQPETPLASAYAAKERELLGGGASALPPGLRELLLLNNLEIGFISGLVDGLSRKIDPQELVQFCAGFEDVSNTVSFYAGTNVGVLVGITDGITDYAVGFYELAKLLVEGMERIPTEYKVALILNPLLAVPSILAKEMYEFLSDPEAVAEVKNIAETIGKAFVEFEEYVRSNPDALVVEGEEFGRAVGEFGGEYVQNMVLLESDYHWKGVAVGNIVGRVALEIALLFVAPEVLAAKGVATGARATASAIRGSRFAQRVVKIFEDIPELKKLFGAISDLLRSGKKSAAPVAENLAQTAERSDVSSSARGAARQQLDNRLEWMAEKNIDPSDLGYGGAEWEQLIDDYEEYPERALDDLEKRLDVHATRAKETPSEAALGQRKNLKSTRGQWPDDPLALPEYRESVDSARQAMHNLPEAPGAKTVAGAETKSAAISGWASEEGASEATEQALREGIEAGYEPAAHFRDPKVPHKEGYYLGSHGEKKAAVAAPDYPIGVSEKMCPDCVRWFERRAIDRDFPQFVSDPEGVHVFMPDRRHLFEAHPSGVPGPRRGPHKGG